MRYGLRPTPNRGETIGENQHAFIENATWTSGGSFVAMRPSPAFIFGLLNERRRIQSPPEPRDACGVWRDRTHA